MAVETDYLGKGIRFPFRINENGGVDLSSGEEHLAEGLRHLVSTRIGERVMRRDYGSRIYEVPFDPNDESAFAFLRQFVLKAARTWERRLVVQDVTMTIDYKENLLRLKVPFLIVKNNREGNLVFPFYLQQSANV
jgi:phage baseplate assembly protein W